MHYAPWTILQPSTGRFQIRQNKHTRTTSADTCDRCEVQLYVCYRYQTANMKIRTKVTLFSAAMELCTLRHCNIPDYNLRQAFRLYSSSHTLKLAGRASGERRWKREAQGMRLVPFFMAPDVSEKYQSQIYRPLEH
jgi:hypothetical protein